MTSAIAVVSLMEATIKRLEAEVEALKSQNDKYISSLACISDMCIGQVAMSINLDAEYIGQMIYADTGLTHPELQKRATNILTQATEQSE